MMKKIALRSISILLTLVLTIVFVPQPVYALAGEHLRGGAAEPAEPPPEDVGAPPAEEAATPTDLEDFTEEELPPVQPQITHELTGLREANVKHFAMDDHSVVASYYPEAVHYEENGEWKDIDNELVPADAEGAGDFDGWQNAANSFELKLAKRADQSNMVRLSEGDYEISWNALFNIPTYLDGLAGGRDTERRALGGRMAKTRLPEASAEDTPFALSATESEVMYKGLKQGVDLEYVPTSDGVKENIIVNAPAESYSYTFALTLKGLAARLTEENTIELYDEAEPETAKYVFPAPYMFDAEEEQSRDVSYSLTPITNPASLRRQLSAAGGDALALPSLKAGQTLASFAAAQGSVFAAEATTPTDLAPEAGPEDGSVRYLFTVTAGAEWVNAPGRTFPVTIDPVLQKERQNYNDKQNGTLTLKCFHSSNPSANHETNPFHVGNNSNGNVCRNYIKFAPGFWPDLGPTGIVSKVELRFSTKTTYTKYTRLYKDTGHENPPYWGSFDPKNQIDFVQMPESTDASLLGFGMDITQVYLDHLKGIHYGLYLVPLSETTNTMKTFNYGMSPLVKITYKNFTGQESYMSTHTQNVGRAGTGVINDYTGNLTFVHDDVTTPGERMPLSLQHVYNAQTGADLAILDPYTRAGNNWRLNYQQTLTIPVGEADVDTYPYVYTDGDGTKHYFKKASISYYVNGASRSVSAADGGAKDEDGLGLYAAPVGDSTLKKSYPYKIADKAGNVQMYFDHAGRLGLIHDANQRVDKSNSATREQNRILITYGAVGGTPNNAIWSTMVTRVAQEVAHFTKTANSNVAANLARITTFYNELLAVQRTDPFMRVVKDVYKHYSKAVEEIHYITANPTSSRATSLTRVEAAQTALNKIPALVATTTEAYKALSKRMTSVTDAAGKVATISYDGNGYIGSISDPSVPGNITYTYSGGNLTGIQHPSYPGASPWPQQTFGYSGTKLTSAADGTGYVMNYTYENGEGAPYSAPLPAAGQSFAAPASALADEQSPAAEPLRAALDADENSDTTSDSEDMAPARAPLVLAGGMSGGANRQTPYYEVPGVTNYERKSMTKALYHFDGALEDSSANNDTWFAGEGTYRDGLYGEAIVIAKENQGTFLVGLPSIAVDRTIEFSLLLDEQIDDEIYDCLIGLHHYTYMFEDEFFDPVEIIATRTGYPIDAELVEDSGWSENPNPYGWDYKRRVVNKIGIWLGGSIGIGLGIYLPIYFYADMICEMEATGSSLQSLSIDTDFYYENYGYVLGVDTNPVDFDAYRIPPGWNRYACVVEDDAARIYVNGECVYDLDVSSHDFMEFVRVESPSLKTNFYGAFGEMLLDEFRATDGVLYTDNYTPSTEPFSDVYRNVLPAVGEEGEIAIDSQIAVEAVYVEFDKPATPNHGDVFVAVEHAGDNHLIDGVTQWQNNAWVPVDASIVDTDEWVDAIGYDITRLYHGLEAPTTPAVDYPAEKITGVDSTMEYRLDDGNWQAVASGATTISLTTPVDLYGKTVQVRYRATVDSVASESRVLPLPAQGAAPAAPAFTYNAAQGKATMTGVSSGMEYRVSTAATWTAIPGTTMTLDLPGANTTYHVRYKGTATVPASNHTALTLLAKYTLVNNISNVTITANTLIHDTSYSGQLTAQAGYRLPASISVTRGAANITAQVSYSQTSGALSIPAAQVTGAITISGAAPGNTYDISLNRNGATNGAASVTATYFSSALAGWAAPTHPVYLLDGYYTVASGGSKVINANGVLQAGVAGYTDANARWIMQSGTILYARWQGNEPVYSSRPRVAQVQEIANSQPGQKFTISYDDFRTTAYRFAGADDIYGTTDDIENKYVFDATGKTVSVSSVLLNEENGGPDDEKDDVLLGGSAYEYTADGEQDSNKITETATGAGHAVNLLKNHSFERGPGYLEHWGSYGAPTSVADSKAFIGARVAKLTYGSKGLYQSVSLPAGLFTFSGYIKTSGLTGGQAYLKAMLGSPGAGLPGAVNPGGGTGGNDPGSAGRDNTLGRVGTASIGTPRPIADSDAITEGLSETTSNSMNAGWVRVWTTFHLDSAATVYLCAEVNGGTAGYALFDAMQLETGTVANGYNILEDSSFEQYAENPENPGYPGYWAYTTESGSKGPVGQVTGDESLDGSQSYKIVGEYNRDKYLKLDLKLGSQKGSYMLSGWIKMVGVTPIKSGRKLEVDFIRPASGSLSKYSRPATLHLPSRDGWVYFSTPVPRLAGTGSYVTIRFYNMEGTIYLDNLQLLRQDVKTKAYSSTGKVTSLSRQATTGSATYWQDLVDTSTTPAGNQSNNTFDTVTTEVKSTSYTVGPTEYFYYDKYGNQTGQYTGGANTSTGRGSLHMADETAYTADGRFTTSTTDTRGYTTSYNYNSTTGLLASVTDPKTVQTGYAYDAQGRQTAVSTAGVTNTYAYDSAGNLSAITHNGFNYAFKYNEFGNQTEVAAAGNKLVGYTYGPNNGKLLTTTYGNNDTVALVYNEREQVEQELRNGTLAKEVRYSNDGKESIVFDHLNDIQYTYDYDDVGKPRREFVWDLESEKKLYEWEKTYDTAGRPHKIYYWLADGNNAYTYEYNYNKDDTPALTKLPDTNKSQLTYTYDALRRPTKVTYKPRSGSTTAGTLTTELAYLNHSAYTSSNKRTSPLVQTYTNKIGSTTQDSYTYAYDAVGNITSISGSAAATYTYDSFGRLKTETRGGKTTTYTYDNGGNILSVAETGAATITYAYDSAWKDKLVSYNGTTISYDTIGNPTNWPGKSALTWENGRQLKSLNGNIHYAYTLDGTRLSKKVGNATTEYTLDGSLILREKVTNDPSLGSYTLNYYYDSAGKLVELGYTPANSTTETYYFVTRNSQGDITALYTSMANATVQKVGSYTYDSWGKVTAVTKASTSSDPSNILNKNPFRYRGYYFDRETNWYYLQSRYYDPLVKRFLNADDAELLLDVDSDDAGTDKNLFAYCDNDPVNRKDDNGHIWNFLAGAVFGAVIGGGIQIVSNLISGDPNTKWYDGLGTAVATGAASGLLAASGVGLVGAVAGNAVISAAGNAVNQGINMASGAQQEFDWGSLAVDTLAGGVTGAIGGKGMGKMCNISTLNSQLSNKVASRSVETISKGIKYYVSQTKTLYKEYLVKPMLKSGAASLTYNGISR